MHSTAAPQRGGTAPLQAVNQWKELLDSGAWDRAWDSTGVAFKSMITRDYWRGVVASRAIHGEVGASRYETANTMRLPGFPDGDYVVFRYETRFQDRSRGADIIAVRQEAGNWRVASYSFILGAPPAGVQPLTDR